MYFIEKITVWYARGCASFLTFCQRGFQIESCLYGEASSHPSVIWRPPLKIFIALFI